MSQPGVAAESAKVSPWGALVKVLYDPAATFAALGEKPRIWPGYLVATVLGIGTTLLSVPVSLRLTQAQLVTQGVPPQVMTFTKIFAYISGAIGGAAAPWLAGLFMTLICMFFGQFAGGSSVSFRSYFGMLAYARVPQVLSGLVTGLLAMRATSLEAIKNTSISLAVFLPADSSPLLKAVVGVFNPFLIWSWVLLAVGFGTLHRSKPSRAAALIITLAIGAILMALIGTYSTRAVPGIGM